MVKIQRGLTARLIREGTEDGSVFAAERNFYCYMVGSGNPSAVLQVILQKALIHISEYEYEKGSDFEEGVIEAFRRAGAPAGLTFSCLYNQDEKLFLATQGQGEIYIQRNGKTMKLLDGDRHAVGVLQDEDVFILTAAPSSASLRSAGGWTAYLEGNEISGHDISGLILTTSVVEAEEAYEERVARSPATPKKSFALFEKLKTMDKKRLLKFGAVAIIAVLLIVSLGVGLIKRANDKKAKQIAFTKDEVTQKLQQAEDVAFLNSGRAAGLINDAKHDVAQLKDQTGGKDTKDIKELEVMIAQKESLIFKKEEKQPSEFFDLAIEDKNATGKLFGRSGSRTAIVNPNGSVYILNLEKKSLDKQSSGVKYATSVAVGDTSVFILGSDGVVQIDENGKAKKVLDKDKDWGTVTDMVTFNNNLYMLDSGKGLIYKYVPAGDGYGGKSSYIKGNAPSLIGGTSIAVDSSVYVSTNNAILKFTTGLQDGFAPQFPDGGVTITKIITAEDVEKVYAWDKPKGLLYIISKNGSYERQVKSASFKKADDVVITKTDAYLLQGQKILRISLN